jgi:hypothetical protein
LGEFGASCGLILSFRGYLGVLLQLVIRYLSIWGLFLQNLVVFGVLEFGGWREFCGLRFLVDTCGEFLVLFLFWYSDMVGWEIEACRGLFEVFVFGLVFYWGGATVHCG